MGSGNVPEGHMSLNLQERKELVRRARELIADRSRWSSGLAATGSDGNPVGPCDVFATNWSADGAIRKVMPGGSDYESFLESELDPIAREKYPHCGGGLVSVNDSDPTDGFDPHAAVLAVFDAYLAKDELKPAA